MAGGCGLDRVARETVLPELAGCSAFQPRSYGHKPAAILDAAAVPGTTITVRGLSAGKAIAGQYCYLPGDAPKKDAASRLEHSASGGSGLYARLMACAKPASPNAQPGLISRRRARHNPAIPRIPAVRGR